MRLLPHFSTTCGSCAGGSSTADLAAELVRRHIGKEAERNALEVLQIDKVRNADSVQSRRPLSIETDDPRLRKALILMEQNVENTMSNPKMAAALGISRRQLERLFLKKVNCSPALVYRRVRLERAKLLLRQSGTPLIEIAMAVGFENASHFARAFQLVYGHSPSVWRRSEFIYQVPGIEQP